MIYIRAHVINVTKAGKRVITNSLVVKKFDNSLLETADFNLLNPSECKKFIRDKVKLDNGKSLPFKTHFDEDIHYTMYFFGVPKSLYDKSKYYTNGKDSAFLNLFPGYPGEDDKFRDKDGKIKGLDVRKFGSIK
jgi:hypothetical protein